MVREPGKGDRGGDGDAQADADLEAELQFHLQGREEELIARGWTPDAARAEALRRFGNVDRVRRESRAVRRRSGRAARRRRGFEAVRQDLWLAWRELVRDRAVALLVVATLALGIGFAGALFTLVDAVLLRPLPYPAADRLVYVWQNDRATGTTREPMGTADFYDFRERTRSFGSMAMFTTRGATLQADAGEPVHVRVAAVHHDLAGVLGVTPHLGRIIESDETEGPGAPVVVLGEALWRTGFGADPGVVGRTVSLDQGPTVVVGVLPRGASVALGEPVDAWIPLRMSPAQATRSPHSMTVVARLGEGVSMEGAASEVSTLAARMEEEDPENRNRGALVETLEGRLRGPVQGTLQVLMGAVVLLLLLTSLNVTNLLLARAASRAREAAVHVALGAGILRTARRTMAGTLLLSVAGGGAGVLVALWLLPLLQSLVPPALTPVASLGLDGRLLLFSILLTLVLALVAGAGPSLWALRLEIRPALSGTPPRGGRGWGVGSTRGFLVAAQAGLAAVLVVGAVLLGSTLRNLHGVEPGFRTDRILRMTVSLPGSRYPADFRTYPRWPERLEFQRELLRRSREVPGVEGAALVVNHPLDPGFTNSFSIEGRPPDPGRGEMTTRMVTPDYFAVAGVDLVEGRVFREGEGVDDPPVVVLNRRAAARHFPDGNALGSRIAFWGPGFREIVGIVEDERVAGLRDEAPPAFYTNLHQTPSADGDLTLMVRSEGDPMALVGPLRVVLGGVDPGLPFHDVMTMEATVAGALERERFAATLVGLFAGMAVVLAALGVYGVLSHAVGQRTREMGIRLALGASAGGLQAMVLRQGLILVGVGSLAGLITARIAANGLGSLLFGIEPGALVVYATTAVLLLMVAALAALGPARRAAGVDPSESLRDTPL